MNKLEKIIEEAKKRSYDVRVRDVGYAVLVAGLGDENLAHKLIFGDDGNEITYRELPHIKYLVNYLKAEDLKKHESKEAEDIAKLITQSKGKKNEDGDDIGLTYEENYAGAVEQLKRIEDLRARCDKDDIKTLKDLEKAESDIRVRLVDKFNVQEKAIEQYIIVQPKRNHICEHTHRECWLQTKEYAKEHWHLIDDPDYKEDKE